MGCFIVLLQLTFTIVYIAVGVFAAGWIGKSSIRISHFCIPLFYIIFAEQPSILTCSV
jgi:hypothetical protein